MTKTIIRSILVGGIAASLAGAAPQRIHPASSIKQEARPVEGSAGTVPQELADAGWTLESLAAMASFTDVETDRFSVIDPVVYPSVQPTSRLSGTGVRPAVAPPVAIFPEHEPDPLKGFALLALWPRGEVLYRFSDEIIDLTLDPPDMPSPNELNALSVPPNSSFIFLYINLITEGRIKFLAYDPAIHTGQGYVLIDVNGPENECGNAAVVGFQGTEGQFFTVCDWDVFGLVVSQFASVIGLQNEHQRPDRDKFVRVLEENVGPPDLNGGVGLAEFEILRNGSVIDDYDYGSITHFPKDVATINPLLNTIEIKRTPALEWLNDNPGVISNLEILFGLSPLDPDYEDDLVFYLQEEMGNGAGFSEGDINSIYTLYGNPGDPMPWIFDPTSGCPADVNQDGRMTVGDLTLFLEMLNSQSIFTDVNNDGLFDFTDFQFFYTFWRPGFCAIPGKPNPPTGRPVIGSGPG